MGQYSIFLEMFVANYFLIFYLLYTSTDAIYTTMCSEVYKELIVLFFITLE